MLETVNWRAQLCDRERQTLQGGVKRILFENRGAAWKGQENQRAERKVDHEERSSVHDADQPTYFSLVAYRNCGRSGSVETAGTMARS